MDFSSLDSSSSLLYLKNGSASVSNFRFFGLQGVEVDELVKHDTESSSFSSFELNLVTTVAVVATDPAVMALPNTLIGVNEVSLITSSNLIP
ncbi:hypothetical protein OGAPHI_002951 [Ogataea philodendri]|uniref:Uncharacterized protein n=1 Tax=Ogataea philodendri TaxID=1378263 RepID=A0A9P8P9L0_9ASCO|nr:uncharacterized protein OGAPHI_002951 [Ogataea philodendri]KAH3667302.1 hypothetical protein OGAPHI_002951 [Ogataea philodendri]